MRDGARKGLSLSAASCARPLLGLFTAWSGATDLVACMVGVVLLINASATGPGHVADYESRFVGGFMAIVRAAQFLARKLSFRRMVPHFHQSQAL